MSRLPGAEAQNDRPSDWTDPVSGDGWRSYRLKMHRDGKLRADALPVGPAIDRIADRRTAADAVVRFMKQEPEVLIDERLCCRTCDQPLAYEIPALKALPPRDALLVVGRFWLGLTNRQLGEALRPETAPKLAPSSASEALSKALNTLRPLLSKSRQAPLETGE